MARNKKEDNTKELMKELNIDKKDLVDEIRKEIKESLDEEIIKKVDYESKNKLDKMEKRIYRQKSWALIRRDIIILLLLAFCAYEGKILYDNGLLFGLNKKEVKTVVKEEKETKEEIVKNSKWYIDNYSYLLDNINTNLSDNDKYYLYLNSIKASDIKNSIKLNMAYQLLNLNSNDGIYKLREEDLKDAYAKIFDLNSYSPENFNNNCINFIYNKDTNTYMAIDIKCNDNKEIFRKIKNIYEENNNIIIETKVGILDKDTNKLSTINGESFDNPEENIDKLKTYKFVFKNSNDKYYLYEIKGE